MENVRQEYLDYVSEFIKVRDLDQSTEFLFPLFDHKGISYRYILRKMMMIILLPTMVTL